MRINLVLQDRRSLGSLRRIIARQVAGILLTVVLGLAVTTMLHRWGRSTQKKISLVPPAHSSSLISQIAVCSDERSSLTKSIEVILDNLTSWKRPQTILKTLGEHLPAEIWLQKLSIDGAKIEIVGVARSEADIQSFASLQEWGRSMEHMRIISTRSEAASGGRVFHLSAQAPLSLVGREGK